MLDIKVINDVDELVLFCKKCKDLGYKNNSTLKEMRWEKTKDWGEYWGAWQNNTLIAVAGAHPLPEVDSNAIRVLFRGCQLYSPHLGISPSHMNSVPFRDILPYQIEKYRDYDLYITTNITRDNSGKMQRSHRAMKLLSKKKIVDLHIKEATIYNTNQSVWKLNKDNYFEVRHRLESS